MDEVEKIYSPSGGWVKPIQKGEVRNPKGKPKGKTFRTIIKELMAGKIEYEDAIAGGKIHITRGEAVILGQLNKAMQEHDTQAARLIMEHAEGKTPNKAEEKQADALSGILQRLGSIEGE